MIQLSVLALLLVGDGWVRPFTVGRSADLNRDGVPDALVGFPRFRETGTVVVISGATGTVLLECEGEKPGDEFGAALTFIDDHDGDGLLDLLVGAPGVKRGAGVASLVSGRNATVFLEYAGRVGDRLGESVLCERDMDGDGKRDFLISAPTKSGVGHVFAFSGASGSRLAKYVGDNSNLAYGRALSTVADLDDDGWPEVVVGAPYRRGGTGNEGYAVVVSGRTGEVIHSWQDPELGQSVAGFVDFDGDGKEDILIGGAESGTRGFGSVRLYSGDDGSLISELKGEYPLWGFGSSLAVVGDMDGDEIPEVAVGAQSLFSKARVVLGMELARGRLERRRGNYEPLFDGVVAGAGDVDCDGTPDYVLGPELRSGKGRLILRFDVWEDTRVGSVASGVDLNRDGCDDLLIGLPHDGYTEAGRVVAFSGKDGAVLFGVYGTRGGEEIGDRLGFCGDVDDDGISDFLVGVSGTLGRPPEVRVHSGRDGSLRFSIPARGRRYIAGKGLCGAGDVNRDGHQDLLIGWASFGKGASGYAAIYSGADGSLVRELGANDEARDFGWIVTSVGDLNADEIPDAYVGYGRWPGKSDNGLVFSGVDGAEIFDLRGQESRIEMFGKAVFSCDSIDGGRPPDLIISGWVDHYSSTLRNLRTWVFSGESGSLLRVIKGVGPLCDCIGDINGDGAGDLLFSSRGSAKNVGTRNGRYVFETTPGTAVVLSGADQSELLRLSTETPQVDESQGLTMPLAQGAGDVNGDSVPDILLGAADLTLNPGLVLYSGVDGKRIRRVFELGRLTGESSQK